MWHRCYAHCPDASRFCGCPTLSSARRDSNPRPPASEAGALSAEPRAVAVRPPRGIRTPSLLIRSQALCPLSYKRLCRLWLGGRRPRFPDPHGYVAVRTPRTDRGTPDLSGRCSTIELGTVVARYSLRPSKLRPDLANTRKLITPPAPGQTGGRACHVQSYTNSVILRPPFGLVHPVFDSLVAETGFEPATYRL